MRLRRLGLTAPRSCESPSRKFTRANDFMVLSALLRNLVTPKEGVSPKGEGGRGNAGGG